MPRYLNTLGEASLAIAVCDRCHTKQPIGKLVSDPNSPGLRVCQDTCVDNFDPWRLPARKTEDFSVQYPRPEVDISTDGTTVEPPVFPPVIPPDTP